MIERERQGTIIQEPKQQTIRGGLQCDEMGLGKTMQMLGTMLNNPRELTLLVCPLAMIHTWQQAAERAGQKILLTHTEGPGIVIVNYDKLVRHPSAYTSIWWDRIVVDEAHALRNPKGALISVLKTLKATIRWALTGTPIVNSARDLFSILSFLGVPLPKKRTSQTTRLHLTNLAASTMIHRCAADARAAGVPMPPEPEVTHTTLEFATPAERDLYRGFQERAKTLAEAAARSRNAAMLFLLLIRLRQISVHPQVYINARRQADPLFKEDWAISPDKATKTAELCRILSARTPTDKYLVFCQFIDEMNILKQVLTAANISTETFNGSMSQTERTAALERARQPDTTVLLIQIQCGGVGLNLQEFNHCIFMSPWWTAALMDQAVARCVRIGQKRQVHVVHLLYAEEETFNIDAFMTEKAENKRVLLENLFTTAASTTNKQ